MEEVLYEKQGGQVTWAGGGQTEAVLAKGAQYLLRGIIMWDFGTEGAILKAHFRRRRKSSSAFSVPSASGAPAPRVLSNYYCL